MEQLTITDILLQCDDCHTDKNYLDVVYDEKGKRSVCKDCRENYN